MIEENAELFVELKGLIMSLYPHLSQESIIESFDGLTSEEDLKQKNYFLDLIEKMNFIMRVLIDKGVPLDFIENFNDQVYYQLKEEKSTQK